MSDEPIINPTVQATGSSLSPRNTDTVVYRVVRELPIKGLAEVGETFSAWPQGEVFACVTRLGLGPVRNSDIEDWKSDGMIVRETSSESALGGATVAKAGGGATPAPENAKQASAGSVGRPWSFPGVL